MAAPRAENGQREQAHDMLIRLFAVAELLLSRPTDEHTGQDPEEQETISAALQKTQAAQDDV